MATFDLKPLSTQTIQELKIRPQDLWEIKIDDNIYGPFETLQLRHYSKENKSSLSRAHVSPMSLDNWRPFFEVREFLHDSEYAGPYWILAHGQKSSPLSKAEINKRIELGTITRHDEISEDDGRHWHRLTSHPEFEHLFTTATALPQVPQESSFQKSKLRVLEQLQNKASWTEEKENIASLTHVSLARKEKTRTVQIENIKVPKTDDGQRLSFWAQYKSYAFMAAPALALVLYFSLKSSPAPEVAEAPGEEIEVQKQSPVKRSRKDAWTRTPASNNEDDYYERSALTQNPPMEENYPTVIETHQEDQNYPDPYREAEQVAEIENQENRNNEFTMTEEQLNRDPAAQEGESLDATMNNEPQEQPNPAVDQPVVEEVSDF